MNETERLLRILRHLEADRVPIALLSNGNADEVYENATECLRAGVDVLNSGCAWPLGTPVGNSKAMIQAATDSVYHP